MELEIPANCQISNLREIYEKYFHPINGEDKIFIEVGAFDGYNFSNTFPLSKAGWSGIYIEPVFDFAEACSKIHSFNKNVTTICCAIGEIECEAEIAVAGTLSTLSSENFKAYTEIDWASSHLKATYAGKTVVPVYRLETILKSLEVKNIDLLVVDVEGSEESVFKSFSFSEYLPKMIICEIEDEHQDLCKYENIKLSNERVRKHISDAGYTEIYRDHINTVFVHLSWPDR